MCEKIESEEKMLMLTKESQKIDKIIKTQENRQLGLKTDKENQEINFKKTKKSIKLIKRNIGIRI